MNFLGYLAALALSTRFHNLSVPTYVCWDETHFGKMAGLYLNRTYFVDVHPPLGKMLIAVAGLLTGYDGHFGFTSTGDEYVTDSHNVRYYGMRSFCAILGSMVVPFLYCTVRDISGSKTAALLSAVFVVFDCGLITLSQYILLDSLLLFFTSAALFCTVKYSPCYHHNCSEENSTKSFSLQWWRYLALAGIFLGCIAATKLTGLLTVTFFGCWTLKDLSDMLKKITVMEWMVHFLARIVCLVFIPCCVYISVFAIHYRVLNKSGQMDGFHTSLFQSCLKGNPLYNASMPLHVAYGSLVTFKHHRHSASGLLHSHAERYPLEVMSQQQQQVTVYFHRDANNFWEIQKPTEEETDATHQMVRDENLDSDRWNLLRLVSNGDVVRLKHVRTGCHLYHLPGKAVPVAHHERVVSCHNTSSGDERTHDLWRIEIDGKPGQKIKVFTTQFKLVHVNTGCTLKSTFKVLPDWGRKQYEVTCDHSWLSNETRLWNIEQHTHRRMPHSAIPPCNMTFWQRFLESHLAMLHFNSEMTGGKEDVASRPWHWLLNYKGQVFTRMAEEDLRVYLLGNPLIFWLNLLVIVLSSAMLVFIRFSEPRENEQSGQPPKLSLGRTSRIFPSASSVKRRGGSSRNLSNLSARFEACRLFLLGWAAHYIPFLFMTRALYFHHYYPAFLFSCCLTGCFLDLVFDGFSLRVSRLLRHAMTSARIKSAVVFFLVACVLESFYLFSPLCYGMTGPFADGKGAMMRGLRLFPEWEI